MIDKAQDNVADRGKFQFVCLFAIYHSPAFQWYCGAWMSTLHMAGGMPSLLPSKEPSLTIAALELLVFELLLVFHHVTDFVAGVGCLGILPLANAAWVLFR